MTHYADVKGELVPLQELKTSEQIIEALKCGGAVVRRMQLWLQQNGVELSESTIRNELKKLVDQDKIERYKIYQDTNYFHQTKAGYVSAWKLK